MVIVTATLAAAAVAVVPAAEPVVMAAQEWALAVPGVELEPRVLLQALAAAAAAAAVAATTETGPALRPSPTVRRLPVRMAVLAERVALARYLAAAAAGAAPVVLVRLLQAQARAATRARSRAGLVAPAAQAETAVRPVALAATAATAA
jgi:hypothetical protein